MPLDYTLYALDLRGYGKSTYHQPIESFSDFVMDIQLFCEALNLHKIYLMGWSNGGGIAMQFAAQFPSQVEKLVLLSSMSTRGFPALNANGERLHSKKDIAADPMIQSMVQAQMNGDQKFFEAAMQMIYSNDPLQQSRIEQYVEAALHQRNIIDVADAANRFNMSSDFNGVVPGRGEVAQINSPVLILWGKNDPITPQSMTLEIIHDLKAHQIDWIYKELDAGHDPFVDDREKVVSEIHHFLLK